MRLNFKQTDGSKKALAAVNAGDVKYFVPYDIDSLGNFCSDGFVALTEKALYVIKGDRVERTFELEKCGDIRCEGMVDCGLLVINFDGEDFAAA